MQMPSLPQKERIAIGMERRRAATLLRTAGARATRLDGVPPPRGAPHAGVAYETRAGGLLVVDYVRPSPGHASQVASLRHCRDPDLLDSFAVTLPEGISDDPAELARALFSR